MSNPALFWNATSSSSLDGDENGMVSQVLVHPLVLLSVLDHHTRRQEGAGRVIGTLLGRRDGTKVEVTNCFAVPHAERGEEVAIGKDFNRQMLALHLRANPKETVVGWYATALPESGDCLADTSSLIHEFYSGECSHAYPIHMVLDTSLKNQELAICAYQSTPVMVRKELLANMFNQVQLTLVSDDSERIVLDQMINTTTTTTDGSSNKNETSNGLSEAMGKLQSLLCNVTEYVDDVVDGRLPAQDARGRQIADTLSLVPRIRPQDFDSMFHDSLQDLLMVTYLSNLTKTQLTIAEKLNATLTTDLK
uniref:Eukaryotic translation initiation factor 3 subunit F n=1 Tax=Eucampia antarctica TaxID=49252 RepID=A0A7S2SJQ2_9STRA|mmetsp:Transcript_9199/g.8816  ORF Transcript_9199/g.8816 Transcript_9199/m.8816 type:complete len:307 (+) Transcript_9199:101-1021(+)